VAFVLESTLVWVRGAGELGSAAAVSLWRAGIPVLMTELPLPLAIRRTVTFSDAILEGTATVEEVKAVCTTPDRVRQIIGKGQVPVIPDSLNVLADLDSDVLVDARMLKGQGTVAYPPGLVIIGLGPGFTAGADCQAVVETQRGPNLGRVIWSGSAQPDSGVPGELGGESIQRVIYAPGAGALKWGVEFGTLVDPGQRLGHLDGQPLTAPIGGQVRGLISPRVPVTVGLKIADIDPRGLEVDCQMISDKARAVGGGVLEALLDHRRKESK